MGERLLLTFARRPALSGERSLGEDGRIALADGARFPAANRTVGQLQRVLAEAYGDVRVTRCGQMVSVLPGMAQVKYAAGMSLGDLLAMAGSKAASATVLRADDTEVILHPDAPLRPGDAVVIPAATTGGATVVGAIRRPGRTSSETLGQAIEAMGGLLRTARNGEITITRGGQSLGPFRLPNDERVPLLAGDLVRIPVRMTSARVTVAGSVRTPGLIDLGDFPTLAEALADAGGIVGTDPAMVVLIRSVVDPKRGQTLFPASKIGEEPARSFRLQPGDIIEVGVRRAKGG